MNLGGPEMLIILILVLVIFGGSQLPKIARNLGSAQNEFKKGLAESRDEAEEQQDPKPPLTEAEVKEAELKEQLMAAKLREAQLEQALKETQAREAAERPADTA